MYTIDGYGCSCPSHFLPKTSQPSPAEFLDIFEDVKRKGDELVLNLRPTQDIAAALGAIKNENQLLVGFALETDNEVQNAQDKMKRKNFDFIVLNSLQDKGAGFRVDTNKITIIDRQQGTTAYETKSKQEVAEDIVEYIVSKL